MAYIEFQAEVKKVNLKPKGKKEIVLEVTDGALDGKLDVLSLMIDQKVEVSLDSLIVNYNVTINIRTNQPVKTYHVDESGKVREVEEHLPQDEFDLGLPPETIPTKEEVCEAERIVVDEFIRSGLAPRYDDLNFDFQSLLQRKHDGESYSKLASELGISSGKIVELIDEYRSRVAPLAMKWDEWRKGQDTGEQQNESDVA